MKAYKVTAKDHEASIIIFAENRNQAKSYGLRNEWFDCYELYIDMLATREKWADKEYKGETVLDFCQNSELFYKNGWYCTIADECDELGCKFR